MSILDSVRRVRYSSFSPNVLYSTNLNQTPDVHHIETPSMCFAHRALPPRGLVVGVCVGGGGGGQEGVSGTHPPIPVESRLVKGNVAGTPLNYGAWSCIVRQSIARLFQSLAAVQGMWHQLHPSCGPADPPSPSWGADNTTTHTTPWHPRCPSERSPLLWKVGLATLTMCAACLLEAALTAPVHSSALVLISVSVPLLCTALCTAAAAWQAPVPLWLLQGLLLAAACACTALSFRTPAPGGDGGGSNGLDLIAAVAVLFSSAFPLRRGALLSGGCVVGAALAAAAHGHTSAAGAGTCTATDLSVILAQWARLVAWGLCVALAPDAEPPLTTPTRPRGPKAPGAGGPQPPGSDSPAQGPGKWSSPDRSPSSSDALSGPLSPLSRALMEGVRLRAGTVLMCAMDPPSGTPADVQAQAQAFVAQAAAAAAACQGAMYSITGNKACVSWNLFSDCSAHQVGCGCGARPGVVLPRPWPMGTVPRPDDVALVDQGLGGCVRCRPLARNCGGGRGMGQRPSNKGGCTFVGLKFGISGTGLPLGGGGANPASTSKQDTSLVLLPSDLVAKGV